MSRRLFNRGRAAASSTSTSTTTTVAALPDYEPLSFPLSDSARKGLMELSNDRGLAPYENQLKDSVRHLGLSVSDLNARLRRSQDRLAALRERREEKGTAKTAEEERLEKEVPEFEKEVERLTRESERALRDSIDRRAELEDEAAVLGDLSTTATTSIISQARGTAPSQRRRRPANVVGSGDEDEADQKGNIEEEEQAVTSVVDTFRELRAKKRAEYNGLSVHERYALNNDYAGFKKLWHEAAAGEDGPPLPDASRWFTSNGEPDMTVPGRDGQTGAFDDDDDVAVQRENISINCPLTLLPMKEPYRSRKCPHTFEKAAILDYLPFREERQCPQTGCSQTFSRARFEHDFYLDEAMKRRIQRWQQQAEEDERDMDDEDDEEEEANESLMLGRERQARGSGRGVKKEER